ncbi:MAG: hypothetical protein ACLFV3_11730 [Phycisphaeraceae bacterium]
MMDPIIQLIRRTRRRQFAGGVLRWLGRLGAAAAGVAAVVILTDRLLLAAELPVWPWGVVAGVVVVAAVIVAWMRRPSEEAAAELLDRRLGLKDRIGSAVWARQHADEPMAAAVMEDARRSAAGRKASEAVRVRLTRSWAWMVPMVALAAGLWWLPEMDLLGQAATRQRQQARAEQAQQAKQTVTEAAQVLRERPEAAAEEEAGDRAALLEELESLAQRDLSEGESLRELDRLRRDLEAEREEKEQELQTVQSTMSRVEPEPGGPADRFAEALRRGDFGEARQEVERLTEQVEASELTPAQKQAFGRQLDQMAEQLDQAARTAGPSEQQLADAGPSEQQAPPPMASDREPTPDTPGQQPDRDAAGDRQADGERQAESDREPQSTPDQQQAQREPGEEPQPGEPSGQQGQQGRQQQAEQSPTGQQPGQQPGQQTQPGGQQQAQPQQQSGQQAEQQQAQRQPADQQPGQQPGQQAQRNSGGQQPGGQQPDGQGLSESLRRMARSLGSEPQPGGQEGFGDGARQAQRDLSEMEQLEREVQRTGQANERLREAMRQAGRTTPPPSPGSSQRQAGRGPGGSMLGPERQPGEVGARGERDVRDEPGRISAWWEQQGGAEGGEAGTTFTPDAGSARDAAERAISEDRVPQRYHESVRRYFEQLPDSERPGSQE